MRADVKRYQTGRFTSYAPLLSLGALGLLAIAAIASAFFSRTLTETLVQVRPDETVKLAPLRPRQTDIGALRVDTRTALADNTWATYEIQIFDSQNQLLATGIKQAWRESGTWYEDGESGTWSERDVKGRFDIQTDSLQQTGQNEEVVVAISVFEHGRTSGQSLSEPVPIRVTVREGVVDGRYLWAGGIGVLALAIISAISLQQSGQHVIDEAVNDSDIGGRSVCGGGDRLVHLTLKIISDETTPQGGHGSLQAQLFIKDGNGEQLYQCQLPAKMSYRREEGKLDSATGRVSLDLVLEPRGSYGFYVEVTPDGPVDWTYLKVYDGKRTLTPTEVIHLSAAQ